MKIGVLELFSWNEVRNGKQKKYFGIDRCCEDCPLVEVEVSELKNGNVY